MGHQLSKVIQYFFSILFPILAYIIGGLANLEFSYHNYIQFNLYHIVNFIPSSRLFSWVSRGWVVVGLAFSGLEVDLVIKIVQFLVDGFWVSVV